MFRDYASFYGELLSAPRPTPKLVDHPLLAVPDCLFNAFAAPSKLEAVLPSTTRGRAMPWWQGPTYRGWWFITCTNSILTWLKSQSTDTRHEVFCSCRHYSNIWIIKIELFPRVLAAIFSVDNFLACWFAQEVPTPGHVNEHNLSHEKWRSVRKGTADMEVSRSFFTWVNHPANEYACRWLIWSVWIMRDLRFSQRSF